MKLLVAVLLIALTVVSTDMTAQEKKVTKKSTISFTNDIFPVIKKRCLPCHAADSENPSELFLEAYADLTKGGKHGKPIIPKNGDGSIIVQKLKPNPPFGEQMPLMTKNKLTADEVELFKNWIDQGAKKN